MARPTLRDILMGMCEVPCEFPHKGSLAYLGSKDPGKIKKPSPRDLGEILAISLEAMDRQVRRTMHMGLPRVYGCHVQEIPAAVTFDGDREDPAVEYRAGRLGLLVDFIAASASAIASGKEKMPKPRVWVPEGSDGIIAGAAAHVLQGTPFDPASYGDPDGPGFWGRETLPEFPRVTDVPQVEMLRAGYGGNVEDPSVYAAHWSEKSEADPELEPCYGNIAEWGKMDDRQSAYYVAWRTRARRGDLRPTCMGYLNLHVAEMLAVDDDPEGIQALMERELMAVSETDPMFLRKAAIDHAMLHGLPLPGFNAFLKQGSYVAWSTLVPDPVRRVSLWDALLISGMDSRDLVLGAREQVYEKAVNDALAEVDRATEAVEGLRIWNFGSVLPADDTVYRFQEGTALARPARYSILIGDGMTETVRVAVASAIRAVNKMHGMPGPAIPSGYYREYSEIAAEIGRRAAEEDLAVFTAVAEERRAADPFSADREVE